MVACFRLRATAVPKGQRRPRTSTASDIWPSFDKQDKYESRQRGREGEEQRQKARSQLALITHLFILTVPAPAYASTESPNTTSQCPICLSEVQTATAAQTGYVYCYTCIYKWVDGSHPRQEAFMEGSGEEEGTNGWAEEGGGSRVGKWESGAGRDAVTGRRVLGGTSGLRRVMV